MISEPEWQRAAPSRLPQLYRPQASSCHVHYSKGRCHYPQLSYQCGRMKTMIKHLCITFTLLSMMIIQHLSNLKSKPFFHHLHLLRWSQDFEKPKVQPPTVVSHETPGSLVLFHLLPCGLPDRNIPHVPVASGFLFGKVTGAFKSHGGGSRIETCQSEWNHGMSWNSWKYHGNIMETSWKHHGLIMKFAIKDYGSRF